MLKWEQRLKCRLSDLEILDPQVLNSFKALDGFEAFDIFKTVNDLEILISPKMLNISEWLAFPKPAGWSIGYKAFEILKEPT